MKEHRVDKILKLMGETYSSGDTFRPKEVLGEAQRSSYLRYFIERGIIKKMKYGTYKVLSDNPYEDYRNFKKNGKQLPLPLTGKHHGMEKMLRKTVQGQLLQPAQEFCQMVTYPDGNSLVIMGNRTFLGPLQEIAMVPIKKGAPRG